MLVSRMRAIVIERPGGPESLVVREVPDPVAARGEVIVRVRATAVNRADILQRLGRYPPPSDAPPDIPGLECAGEIESIGPGVRGRAIGDRVHALLPGGGYAERVRVAAGLLMPVPPGWSWPEAGALPECHLTAFDALVRRARVRPGETVLVHAAASGVGLAAIEIANLLGVRCIALSRSEERRDRLARELGVIAVDPGSSDAVSTIRDRSDGGVHAVLDLVGAAAWDLNCAVLRERGRWILVGLLSGSRTEIDLGRLLARRLTVVGTVLRTRAIDEKRALVRSFTARLAADLAARRLVPIVDRVLPLERAADAHRAVERNEHFGKIVLEVG